MCEKKQETVDIQIDEGLLKQVTSLAGSMGLTPEDLVNMFFEWCTSPETMGTAIDWLQKYREDVVPHETSAHQKECDPLQHLRR